MPIPHVTPSPTATSSTWQIGTYNAVTDTWTLVLDLNDLATWFVKSYDIAQPEKVISRSGNPRTHGERINNERYKNRFISLTLQLRSTTTLAALDTAIHSLEAALDNTPWVLRFAEAQASQYTYAVVKSWLSHIPQDPLQRLAKAKTGITLVLECEPGLLGDRLYLDNLIVNPGFEAPSGPGVTVFSDTFANVNAYAVQAGGAPTLSPANTFVDVMNNNGGANLLRYLRLGEASGTTAYDISGMAQHGTYTSVTLGSTALVSGDTGTSYLFNGTSSKVTIPTAGLPTGNAAMTLGVAFQISALPGATVDLVSWGTTAGSVAHQNVFVAITSTGKLQCDLGAGTGLITGATTITTGVRHLAEVKWDGTTLSLFLDGASQGTSTPGAQAIPTSSIALILGSFISGAANFFSGNLQEFYFFNAANSAQAARWTAVSSGASGTVSNAMSLPAAGRVAFGSPAWGALQTWQIRFRFVTAQVPIFYLHFTDASNYLAVDYGVTAGTLRIVQVVSGSTSVVASAAVVLTHEAWYWLQIVQFPTAAGTLAYVQATLSYDDAGAIGSAVTNGALGPVQTFDGVTALIGRPQIAASGAALVIGGNFTGVHTVSLFGPGGWSLVGLSATGPSSGAWEQTTANTYPGGPVTSYGAARIDLPPAGTVDWRFATWDGSGGATGAAQFGIPTAQNHVLGFSVAYKTSAGLSATSGVKLMIKEHNSSGTEVASVTFNILSGTTSTSWATYANTYTVTNAAAVCVRVLLQVTDTVAGASANQTVWFDNVQLWDQTALGGQATMGYCELRFPQSPAQLVVSGLVGDLPAPVSAAVGTYVSSMSVQHTMNLVLGAKALPIAAARLVGPSLVRQGPNASSTIVPTLNSSFYGGYYVQENYTGASTAYTSYYYALSDTPANLQGIYALFEQFMTSQASYSAITAQSAVVVSTGAFDPGAPTYSQRRALVQSVPVAGVVIAQNNQIDTNVSPIFIPPYGQDSLMDLTKSFVAPAIWWTDPNAANPTTYRHGWQALIPIDSSMLVIIFTTGKLAGISTSWVWLYSNGIGTQQIIFSNTTYSIEPAALSNPGGGVGGPASINNSSQGVTPTGDAYLTLDPTQSSNGVSGVAQLVGYLTVDQPLGAVLPLHCTLTYTPQYLDPR